MSVAKQITKAIYRYFAAIGFYLPESCRADVEKMIEDLLAGDEPSGREDRTPAPPDG